MNIEKKSVDVVSEALQTAAFVPDQWMTALEALARATNSSHAELVCWTRPKRTPLKLISNLSDAQAALIRKWEAHVGDDPVVNPVIAKGIRMPILDVLMDEEVIGSSERTHHVVFNEHYDKIDMPHMCFSPLWRSNDSVLGLFILRSFRDGPVRCDERRLFGQLAARWRDAALTARVLKDEGARVLAGALNALSINGIFLDGMGRCTGVSLNAESLVADATVVTVRNDRLRLGNGLKATARCARSGTTIDVDADLRPCIDCITGQAVSVVSHCSACSIVVKRPSGFVAHLRLSAIPRHRHEICFSAAALVVVESLEARSRVELLPDVVQMLTPAERDVAVELANGKRPAEIAERQGISVDTIRTHVKRMYAKLGVSSLVEFIARVRR